MRSRLLRIGVLALAAFAVMPGTALALDSSADSAAAVRVACTTHEPCPEPLCLGGPTWTVCVLKLAI